jgi:transcriptional regulator with XRE-family HTH domain
MVWDYSKLRGKIKEKYGTQEAFASAIGISATSLSLKLNNEREFTQAEMNASIEALELPHAGTRYIHVLTCSISMSAGVRLPASYPVIPVGYALAPCYTTYSDRSPAPGTPAPP